MYADRTTNLFCMVLWAVIFQIKSTYTILQIGSIDIRGKMLVAGIRFFFAVIISALILNRKSRKSMA